MHAQVLVHDRHFLRGRPHLARPRRVVLSADVSQYPGVQSVVGGQVFVCGIYSANQVVGQWRRLGDFDTSSDSAAHPLPVPLVREVSIVQVRLLARVGGHQRYPARSDRLLERDAEAAVRPVFRYLDGRRTMFAGEQYGTHLHIVAVRRPGRRVSHTDLYRGRILRGCPLVRFVEQERRRVVPQVPADARDVLHNGYVEGFEVIPGPHAGEHEQVRRVYRATAQDYLVSVNLELVAAALGLNAYGTVSVEYDPVGENL